MLYTPYDSSCWTGAPSGSQVLFAVGTGQEILKHSLIKNFALLMRASQRIGLVNVSDDCTIREVLISRRDTVLMLRYKPDALVGIYRAESTDLRAYHTSVWDAGTCYHLTCTINLMKSLLFIAIDNCPGPIVVTVVYGHRNDPDEKLCRTVTWPQPRISDGQSL